MYCRMTQLEQEGWTRWLWFLSTWPILWLCDCGIVWIWFFPFAEILSKHLQKHLVPCTVFYLKVLLTFKYCFELLCMICSRAFWVLNQQQCAKTPLVVYDNSSNWSCRFIADRKLAPVNKKSSKTTTKTPGSVTAGPTGGMVVKLCVREYIRRYVIEREETRQWQMNLISFHEKKGLWIKDCQKIQSVLT